LNLGEDLFLIFKGEYYWRLTNDLKSKFKKESQKIKAKWNSFQNLKDIKMALSLSKPFNLLEYNGKLTYFIKVLRMT
jgi:hypothetical protein